MLFQASQNNSQSTALGWQRSINKTTFPGSLGYFTFRSEFHPDICFNSFGNSQSWLPVCKLWIEMKTTLNTLRWNILPVKKREVRGCDTLPAKGRLSRPRWLFRGTGRFTLPPVVGSIGGRVTAVFLARFSQALSGLLGGKLGLSASVKESPIFNSKKTVYLQPTICNMDLLVTTLTSHFKKVCASPRKRRHHRGLQSVTQGKIKHKGAVSRQSSSFLALNCRT